MRDLVDAYYATGGEPNLSEGFNMITKEKMNEIAAHVDKECGRENGPGSEWLNTLTEKLEEFATQEQKEPIYEVEIEDTEKVFRFRLVNKTSGRMTNWCGYSQIAMLDNKAVATQYYVSKELELRPISAQEIMKCFAVGESIVRKNV